MEPKVLFEDDYLLVINKPAGWIVNEATTTGSTPVLQSWLAKNFDYPIAKNSEYRSGIVHRLDKETSGLLLIAKTIEVFNNLQAQFKNRVVKKTYKALVHGKVEPPEGEIKAPVGRLPWRRDRFGVLPGGREATTTYKVLESYMLHSAYYNLLELFPKTGRTHQIRIHLKYLGHPIVADEFYAGRKTARKDRIWCPRLFLHAASLSLSYPSTSKTLTLSSELPKDLSQCLIQLEKLPQTP